MKTIWDFLDGYKSYIGAAIVMAAGIGLTAAPFPGAAAAGAAVLGIGIKALGSAHKQQKGIEATAALTEAISAASAEDKRAVIEAVMEATRAEISKQNALPPETAAALQRAAEAVSKKVLAPAVLLLGLAMTGLTGCAAAKQYQATHDDECLVACAVRGGIECKNEYDSTQDGQLLAQCITLKGVDCSTSCRKPAPNPAPADPAPDPAAASTGTNP